MISTTTRRTFCRRAGVLGVAAAAGSLSGCVGPWNDSAYYWSEPGTLGPDDAGYETVRSNASEAGYAVEEPYYVNAREPGGIHPEGTPALEERLGPDYRVYGFAFYHTPPVFLSVGVTGGTTLAVYDDRTVTGDFDVESFPPEEWLLERIRLSFDLTAETAATYAADLREQVVAGTQTPRIDLTEEVTFPAVYAFLEAERADVEGSETGGDGWYVETSLRDGDRFAVVDFVVRSLAVVHRDGNRTYRLKLDRLGGFNLRIELPAGEEIPEPEYREVFRRLFEDVGLDPDHVDGLTFEYTGSIW
ncbi:MAG: hypothetical protein V5A46_04955 [Haloferacaceae archaeon]